MHPLVGCRAKLRRAKEHFNALNLEVERFLDSYPYTVVQEYDSNGSEHVFRIAIWEEPPSLQWGVIIGDGLHNLRSCLDHLAFILAEAHGTGATTRTEFPIFRDKEKFYDSSDGLRKIKAITNGDVRTLIEEMQPFSSGQNAAHWQNLWVLHELSNIDKHRFTHLAGAMFATPTPLFDALPVGASGLIPESAWRPVSTTYLWAVGLSNMAQKSRVPPLRRIRMCACITTVPSI